MNERWYKETLYTDVSQTFKVSEVFFEDRSDHQHLIVFQNPVFGRMLALDGVIQVTQNDEFVYHEMMTHVPLFSHPNPKRVLIIGGGDGGIAREVLRHPLDHVTMVEIDRAVVDMCVQHMPSVSNGVFDNPKLNLVIDDGFAFVNNTTEQFDVIIVDSTDPIGPGAILFTREFYQACHRCLTTDGILVTQNGVPYMQGDELTQSVALFREKFSEGRCYVASIPTYYGGVMALGWASKGSVSHKSFNREAIAKRLQTLGLQTKYYTPDVHLGAFCLPRYVEKLLP